MNNNINLFDDLLVNPVPMEFSQKVTTMEFLASLNKKLSDLLNQQDNNDREYWSKIQLQLNDSMNNFTSQFNKTVDQTVIMDKYLNTFINYATNHVDDIIKKSLEVISFGLDSDGNFCAFIPDQYDNVVFDSVADSDDSNFGKLCLTY